MGFASSQTPIPALLLTVFNSILEVFLLCLAGYILAGQGILDKKTQKQLNRLNVFLFTPALLFSKVAFFLSPGEQPHHEFPVKDFLIGDDSEKLRELWVVPIFFVIVSTVSMTVSFTLGWMFGLKKSQRSFAMAAAMFMNSNSLPIALMQSLVVSVPSLKWSHDDNTNAMVGRALTYLVVYSTLGMVLRWSYGVRLLSQADDDEKEPEITVVTEETPLLIHHDRELHHSSTYLAEPDAPTLRPPPRRRTTYYRSFPNSPTQEETFLPSSSASSDSGDDTAPLPLPTHTPTLTPTPTPRQHKYGLKKRLGRAWATFNNFMTVPLWASLLSIVVACIRPVQHVLETHLLAVKGALSAAGNCSIPLTLVVLGAYFYPTSCEGQEGEGKGEGDGAVEGRFRSLSSLSTETLVHSVKDLFRFKKQGNEHGHHEHEAEAEVENGVGAGLGLGLGLEHGYGCTAAAAPVPAKTKVDNTNRGETKTVVIAVLSRMVITPLLLMPLVALSAKFDWQRVFEDPVFVVANVLLVSSPPALTLAQITQAASGDAFERLISRTIFWSYCVVTPPATIFYVVLGLVVAKL
ncbi:hypothetical protein D9615_006053 [Tricholomella constricta]|uniref:Auxin efflux carrier n=1 Tax=Tricholomella constricta TaxID=117010 RepID=A0A8H5M342_9AGAR|nr:hypothetical protein D9615_006053 [Tricholomella constricta]